MMLNLHKSRGSSRRSTALLLLMALLVVMGVTPAAGTNKGAVTAEHITELPIADTENPCGSAVGSAEGFGVVTTRERSDGSTRVVTRFIGEFLVELTGDPVPNVWDEAATSLEGLLALTVVEDSREGFRLKLRVWGETDTGVEGRINQKVVAGEEGGYMVWNCFDGTGRHRVDF